MQHQSAIDNMKAAIELAGKQAELFKQQTGQAFKMLQNVKLPTTVQSKIAELEKAINTGDKDKLQKITRDLEALVK